MDGIRIVGLTRMARETPGVVAVHFGQDYITLSWRRRRGGSVATLGLGMPTVTVRFVVERSRALGSIFAGVFRANFMAH